MSTPRSELKGRLASLCALSAAGTVAVTVGAGEANADIVVVTVNEGIGFAPGDIPIDIFPLSGGVGFGIATTTYFGVFNSLFIAGTLNANFMVKTQAFYGAPFARPLDAGVFFGTAPGGSSAFAYLQWVTSSGSAFGPAPFANKYFAFTYEDAGQTRYGWVEGSLTSNTFDGLSYHVNRYAFEDTGVMIATGQTSLAAVPEPGPLSLSLLGGALVGGAAGVRRWKKAKADGAAAA